MTILNKNYNGEGTPDIEVMSGSIDTQSKTIQRILLIQQSEGTQIIEKLSQRANDDRFRKLQREGMNAIVESMKHGKTSGVIKLPTGTGKTRLFCELLRAIGKNGLILVPRIDLYDSTVRDLIEAGFSKEKDIHLLHEQEGGNTANRLLSLLTDPVIDWGSGTNQCIMTYQALTSLVSKNAQMSSLIQSHFDVVIEDEAHRGLGDKTKEAIGGIAHNSMDQPYDPSESNELDDEEINELSIEEKAEQIISGIKYNYKFTATPDLLGKSVAEDGEYIYYATVEDAVRSGAIVLPQYVDIGAAYTKNANLDSWKISDIEKLSEGDNFVDESGKSIRDTVIDAYIEKKNEVGGVLPGVAFASTIKHAEDIVAAYKAKGIRAQRVTSDTRDISSKEATEKMDQGKLDVIVTVTKVSEGFDYPPLGCAMWFCPSLSPAKIFQGNGRIMRVTDKKKTHTVIDHDGKIIPSPQAFIIAPSVWYGGSSERKETIEDIGTGGDELGDEEYPNNDIADEDNEMRKPTLPRIGNFYELLVDRGEFDINSLGGNLREIIDIKSSIRCEVGEEIVIDGISYKGLIKSPTAVNGYIMRTMVEKAELQKINIIVGKQANGMRINLIPLDFINKNKIDHICSPGQIIAVNGVQHRGVVKKMTLNSMFGGTILDQARAMGIPILDGKQPHSRGRTGQHISLIPESFILTVSEGLVPGDTKIIEGVKFFAVVDGIKINGVLGKTIIHNYRQINLEISTALKKGKGKKTLVYLIPETFIDSLKKRPKCNHGQEVSIDEVIYVGITTEKQYENMSGASILAKARKLKVGILDGVQENERYKIKLIPKDFIDKLKSIPKSGDTYNIDGIDHVRITFGHEINGIEGRVLENRAKIDGISIKEINLIDGTVGKFIPKEYLDMITQKFEIGEGVIINGISYLGISSVRGVIVQGMSGKFITDHIRKKGIKTLSRYKQDLTPITLVPEDFVIGLQKNHKLKA